MASSRRTLSLSSWKLVPSSKSLRQVYRRGTRFYNLVAGATKLKFEEREQYARFYLALDKPELDPEHVLIDFLLLLWHRFPSWLIGQRIPLRKIGFMLKFKVIALLLVNHFAWEH